MSTTILEALQNADHNMDNINFFGTAFLPLIKGQLHNATILLEKGYGIDEEVDSLLEKYGDVESVPEKE